jgi:hypothetical protein
MARAVNLVVFLALLAAVAGIMFYSHPWIALDEMPVALIR